MPSNHEESHFMEIRFPGGAAVDAVFKGHTIRTDQPEHAGGADSGPAPFDLFLASIATCAGYYALMFCKQRDIELDGMKLTLEPVRDPERRRLGQIKLHLQLPEGFPEKYRPAIIRSIDQCAVKRHIVEAPEIVTEIA
jgi:ribosomal protein S12 methylthiotransferase accessory factor